MNSDSLFTDSCVVDNLSATSKKQLLQEMADVATQCGAINGSLSTGEIVSAVMERERLGSTGVGGGVALPHARLSGLDKVRAVFARLEKPISYEAVDDRPVDLVVLLLAPKEASGDHLKALAKVSRLLRKQDMRNRLRTAPDAESLYHLLIGKQKVSIA